MSQKFSGLHLKPFFQNSLWFLKPVAVTRIPLSNFENNFPFSPFFDSCPSKIRVKTWGDKSYIEEPHVIPTKVRNKLLLFHYRKISITQNYERKTNLIQRAYILT